MPGLSTQISETGVSVQTEILGFDVETAHGMTAALGTPEVLALKRLRSVDGSPIALIHTWLPLPLCAELRAEDLRNTSLHGVLREKLGIDVTAGRRQIRAAPADADLLSLLRMETHSPVLLLEGTSVDASGRTVEVFTTWHHADQVVFDIDVVNDAGNAPNGFSHSHGLAPDKAGQSATSGITGIEYGNLEPLSERAHALAVELDRFAKEVRARIRQP